MGQLVSAQAERYAVLSGASVLYVLGLALDGVIWVKGGLVDAQTPRFPAAPLHAGDLFRTDVA